MNEIFKKFHSQLVKEGILKAILCAAIIAFISLVVCGFVFWFIDFKAVWLCAIIFVAVLAIAAPIFYFLLFRPTMKAVARRIDAQFGTEERMITMAELEGNNSFMANKQRENAVATLNGCSGTLKVFVATSLLIGIGAAALCGAGMVTVSGLAAADVIPSGKELIAKLNEKDPVEYTVKYTVLKGSGEILGETVQTVLAGEDATPVLATASSDSEVDWVFAGWSDGWNNPYRQDLNVTKNLNLSVTFETLDGVADDEEEARDGTQDNAGVPQEGQGQGGENGDGPRQPSESGSSNSGETGDGDSDGDGESEGEGAGGGNDPNNQVQDGQTFYGDTYENDRSEAMEEISGNDEMPDELKQIIEDYYDTIKK